MFTTTTQCITSSTAATSAATTDHGHQSIHQRWSHLYHGQHRSCHGHPYGAGTPLDGAPATPPPCTPSGDSSRSPSQFLTPHQGTPLHCTAATLHSSRTYLTFLSLCHTLSRFYSSHYSLRGAVIKFAILKFLCRKMFMALLTTEITPMIIKKLWACVVTL